MEPVSCLPLIKTTESTAQCLELHFLLYFCFCGHWFFHHHCEGSRTGAWAPSTQPQGLHTVILNKSLLFDKRNPILLRKKQKHRKEKPVLNLNQGLKPPSQCSCKYSLSFSCYVSINFTIQWEDQNTTIRTWITHHPMNKQLL